MGVNFNDNFQQLGGVFGKLHSLSPFEGSKMTQRKDGKKKKGKKKPRKKSLIFSFYFIEQPTLHSFEVWNTASTNIYNNRNITKKLFISCISK